MFKRRNKRSWARIIAEAIYPRGGWIRAASYIWHRLRRLPDPPHKISRGVAAGIFASFTPFFGFHFVIATLLSLIMQGNILAALLATFVGNPFTFPIIATVAVDLGSWMLGHPGGLELPSIVGAFSNASVELWDNFKAMFTDAPTHWASLSRFFRQIFLPYLVGGLIPGIAAALAGYLFTYPIIAAYQARRIKRLKRRYEKRRLAQQARADGARDNQ